MILSVAAMLRTSLGLPDDAARIETAVRQTVEAGIRTADIRDPDLDPVTTSALGDSVVARIRDN